MKLLALVVLLFCIYIVLLRRSRKKRLLPESRVITREGSPTDLENFSVIVITSEGKKLELKFMTYFNVLMKPEELKDDDIQVGDWLFFRPHDRYKWSDTSRVRTKLKDGFPEPNLRILSALKQSSQEEEK